MPQTSVRRKRGWVLGAPLLLPWACAVVSPLQPPQALDAECQRFLENLDRVTDARGVRTANAVSIVGAPYLRANRFLASLASDVQSPEAEAAWLERLRVADEQERISELAQVGQATRNLVSPFPGLSQRESLRQCGLRLVQRDLRSPRRIAWIKSHATAPDSYSRWHRILGGYALTRWVLGEAVASLHRERRAALSEAPDPLSRRGSLVRYRPPGREAVTPDTVRRILDGSSNNALHLPEPGNQELDRLYESFAPDWEIETLDENDKPGSLRWGENERPAVDTSAPAVYRFESHTRFGADHLLQLNYLVWFPSSPPTGPLDLHSGRLDGVIWRVTLSPDGRPLAYDTIHASGCYYQLYPGIGFRVQQPTDGSEAVLSPHPIAAAKPGERLVIGVSAGRHWVEAVATAESALDGNQIMRWRDFRELLSLPSGHALPRSVFGATGLIAGTARRAGWLLWPSGIESPGAMRQPGTHAIALTGRRHFDDARLFDPLMRRLQP